MAGVNPEERARAREQEPVEIGDREFVQLRRTPKVMRAYRGIVREDEDLGRKQDRLDRQIVELDEDAPEEDRAKLIAGRVKIEDDRETTLYKLALCLLGPKEDEQKPTLAHLQEHLDLEDLEALIDRLTPGDSERQDPTPAATESTGS